MISPFVGRINIGSAAATTYMSMGETVGTSSMTTENLKQSVASNAGTISNLFVKLTTAPGLAASGKKWDITLRVNGVDTALTVSILETATSGVDTTHSVSYNAGDLLSIKVVPTATPATSVGVMSMDNTATSQVIVTGDETAASVSANSFIALFNGRNLAATTDQAVIIPTGGTISKLYVVTDVAPAGAASYAVTLVKGGVDQTLTATVSGAATSSNDTTHSVSVSAADTCYFKIVPTGTPVAARIHIAVNFTPTTDGESIIAYATTGALTNAAANNFMNAGSGAGGTSTVETGRSVALSSAYTLKKLYASIDTAPGAGNSFTYTARSNLANTTLTCQITGAGITTANDTTNTPAATAQAYLSVNAVSAGTPTAAATQWSLVTYKAPTVASGSTFSLLGVG